MTIISDQDRETFNSAADITGSDTHSGNAGGNIPDDASSLDLDYDPGASELSEDIAEDVAESE
ncbi:MAG: hypothetical protein ABJA02_14290 [Acidobacteriota bacterium]